jgi:hypothetical protein
MQAPMIGLVSMFPFQEIIWVLARKPTPLDPMPTKGLVMFLLIRTHLGLNMPRSLNPMGQQGITLVDL